MNERVAENLLDSYVQATKAAQAFNNAYASIPAELRNAVVSVDNIGYYLRSAIVGMMVATDDD